MTRADIRTAIRKELGETTSAFWSDAEINSWINRAGHDIAFKSKCITATGKFTTSTGVSEYNMSTQFTGFLSPLDVYLYQNGDTWEKLIRTNREELDNEYPGWKSADNGTPDRYIFEADRSNILTLYVPPDANNSGTDYAEVYYSKDFVDMTTDTDDLSTQFRNYILEEALIDFVVSKGHDTRGFTSKSQDRMGRYEGKIQQYRIYKSNERDEEFDIIMKNYRNV